MTPTPKLLVFAGSLREQSWNKRLARLAASVAEDLGAEVEFLDLRDYPLPLFDQDLEKAEGEPANAIALKPKFAAAVALLIASQEYNSSITGVLKNTIDWLSRPAPEEPPLIAFKGKVAGLLAASPGALGGLRGLVHVRAILGVLGMIVVPDQLALSRAHEAFDERGTLRDAGTRARLDSVVGSVVEIAGRLKN
jgi:NAD(P)H-dependent FMN reductase